MMGVTVTSCHHFRLDRRKDYPIGDLHNRFSEASTHLQPLFGWRLVHIPHTVSNVILSPTIMDVCKSGRLSVLCDVVSQHWALTIFALFVVYQLWILLHRLYFTSLHNIPGPKKGQFSTFLLIITLLHDFLHFSRPTCIFRVSHGRNSFRGLA